MTEKVQGMDKLKGMKCIGWMSARWRDAAVCFLLFPALSLLAVVGVDNPLLPQDDMAAQWDRMGRVVPAVLAYVCFLLWIVRNCRSLHGRMSEVLSWAVMLAAGWQAVLGLLQIYGFEASKHSGYAMTGSFFNPGPYAGFLAVAFPLAADFWFRTRSEAFGKRGADLDLCLRFREEQDLLVGIDGDVTRALDPRLDHAVDCIVPRAAYADDLDPGNAGQIVHAVKHLILPSDSVKEFV